jgi:hypothetical protein
MIIYMIRNKGGLFSTGGCNPSFTDTGKVWKKIGPVKSHLNLVLEREREIPEEWEIVSFNTVEVGSQSAKELSEEHFKERKRKEKIYNENHHRNYLKREISRMQEELENL